MARRREKNKAPRKYAATAKGRRGCMASSISLDQVGEPMVMESGAELMVPDATRSGIAVVTTCVTGTGMDAGWMYRKGDDGRGGHQKKGDEAQDVACVCRFATKEGQQNTGDCGDGGELPERMKEGFAEDFGEGIVEPVHGCSPLFRHSSRSWRIWRFPWGGAFGEDLRLPLLTFWTRRGGVDAVEVFLDVFLLKNHRANQYQ